MEEKKALVSHMLTMMNQLRIDQKTRTTLLIRFAHQPYPSQVKFGAEGYEFFSEVTAIFSLAYFIVKTDRRERDENVIFAIYVL